LGKLTTAVSSRGDEILCFFQPVAQLGNRLGWDFDVEDTATEESPSRYSENEFQVATPLRQKKRDSLLADSQALFAEDTELSNHLADENAIEKTHLVTPP
jgi:hypothetical protein